MSSIAEQIEILRREIHRHDTLYYVRAEPEISDREYDRLMDELIQLEAENPGLRTADSPTQRVSGEPIEGFQTVTHAARMLSIQNTYNRGDVLAFDKRVKKALADIKFHYIVDPKVDGVAASLRYEKGVLVLAATRGDGTRGDDITNNAKPIRSIPLALEGKGWPEVLEIRGEVYWPGSNFAACNAKRIANGQDPFANPRNGTAGTLKQLDPKVVAQRKLAFVPHGIGEISELPASRASELMDKLESWGFLVGSFRRVCENIEQAIDAVTDWFAQKALADYETDGAVIKIDELDLRDELGATSKYPRWCIAYKYEAEQSETVLRNVDFQVGRLGTITPVAHFDPVQLAGTTVSNASLHNFDQVERLDVRVGDTIVVEKAGEIIPQVVRAVQERRPEATQPISPPENCPACDSQATRDEGGVYLRCNNLQCPAQLSQRLIFFAGRGQMDIENLGPALIDQLLAGGLVKNFADLYELKADQLADLDRMAEKSSHNVIEAIEASKSRGLIRLLTGLGVRHVGARAAEVLAGKFGDIDGVASATAEELTEIDEIGPVIAQSVFSFFQSESGTETISRLRAVGVDMTAELASQASGGLLAGKTVVVTGTLESMSRSEAEAAVKLVGGKATSSVSAKTDFVVAGPGAGSKAHKAESLGVEIIDEAQFLARLGRSN